ncbi:hypothetical protein NDU88_006256 [Pleurodeles waltl]|uniref:Uncharacterized protein n=1 Tax=Pleurodeles waltl TaxID=8319 RepID=A0AAV7PMY0_PLEWA|nr:hypothetical protein NDU88_006256 [Pleurodeles waltl]
MRPFRFLRLLAFDSRRLRLLCNLKGLPASGLAGDPAGLAPDTTIDHILQEITSVGRRLEGMDSNISELMAETKSIHMDIVGLQNRAMDLEHHVSMAENHFNTLMERDQELLFLQSQVIDLED